MPGIWVNDPRSTALFGRSRAIVLTDGKGHPELDAALDPLPRRSGQSVEPGDPFENRGRPLYLAISSDCASLRRSTLRALVELGRLPGVRVDLMPGLSDLGVGPFSHIAWSGTPPTFRVTTTREPETTWFVEASDDWLSLAQDALGVDAQTAGQLMVEANAFEALGYDYLVSPTMAGARDRNRRSWPNELGAVTPEEAFRLAGTKSRMYRMLPVQHDSGVPVSTSIGRIYDLAVTRWTPGLLAAITGAINANDPAERGAVPFLLGIRARLGQLLLARDEVYRLTRSEALDLGASWPKDESRSPARKGNELASALAYHAIAGLDHAYAVGDALAWVAAMRDGNGNDGRRTIGLRRLLDGRDRWTRGPNSTAAREHLRDARSCMLALATRELRNRNAHRDGLSYGRLSFDPPATDIPQASVVWVHPETFVGDPTANELFRAVAHRANYFKDDLAVMTFLRLVDEVWCATTEIVSCGLGAMKWSDHGWLRTSGQQAGDTARLWRTHTQRLLWAMPAAPQYESPIENALSDIT